MAPMIGSIVGGTIAVFLLSMLFEWAITKRVFDSPEVGIPASVAIAVVVAIIIAGFGAANGGPWRPFPMGFYYMGGGAIVLIARMVAVRNRRNRQSGADTFE